MHFLPLILSIQKVLKHLLPFTLANWTHTSKSWSDVDFLLQGLWMEAALGYFFILFLLNCSLSSIKLLVSPSKTSRYNIFVNFRGSQGLSLHLFIVFTR